MARSPFVRSRPTPERPDTIRRWMTWDNGAVLMTEANAVGVDRPLLTFAACQCARTVVKLIRAQFQPVAEQALTRAEMWALGRFEGAWPHDLRDIVDVLDDEYGPRETGADTYATGAVICAAASAYGERSLAVEAVRFAAIAISVSAHGGSSTYTGGPLKYMAEVVRKVIPFPRSGTVVAMGPGFFVVQAPRGAEFGVQLTPRRVDGRWADGWVTGAFRDVLPCIPDPEVMVAFYEQRMRGQI